MSKRSRMRYQAQQRRRGGEQSTSSAAAPGDELELEDAGLEDEHQAEQTEAGGEGGQAQAEDPYVKLQREYAELKTTRDLEARQLAEERARREQLEAAHGQAEQDIHRSHQAVIDQAINAATLEADQATAALEAAFAAGDARAVAAAQRKLTAAETRLARLGDGKEALAAQEADRTRQRAAPNQGNGKHAPQDAFEAEIVKFSEPSKRWLRENPEVVTDPATQRKAIAAHNLALLRDIKPDTDEYFEFLEESLWPDDFQEQAPARQEAPARRDPDVGQQRQAQAPARRYSAPASRRAGGSGGNRETPLTATQKEYARSLGMSDKEYGDYLQQARARKLVN